LLQILLIIFSLFKYKRNCFLLLIFGWLTLITHAQKVYFQQEVNYTINVTLNDKNHSLSAKEEIQYTNHSPDTLKFIYFHLWPNAYKNNSSALAKQLLLQEKTDFFFSTQEERGFIDSLNFVVDGKKTIWEYDSQHIDICKVFLPKPLAPNEKVNIKTPFYVKIPDAKFSRLGHTQQAYFMTQWYPKPAVYDNSGWHPMPYLDQGEFYSEFGNFDVSITLPENYVLAATGDRVDAEKEEDFLNKKVIETLQHFDNSTKKPNGMEFPESSTQLKTVRFKQFNVHDFAWFTDKRFYVLHDQIQLPLSKREVDTWSFFTDKNFELWKKSISYINDATLFYSQLFGDYPYNHVTAVDGTIMAGGGMEYPNITVIGDMTSAFDLDNTIAHEVGHNWFYGILANNERDYPALDEGINSLYEMRYARAKYPNRTMSDFIGRDSSFKFFGLNKIKGWKEREIAYYMSAKSNSDQQINTPSQDFTDFNYASIVYSKTALILDYLMEYMTEANFDEAMRFYYNQFKFKHPTQNDFIKTLSFFSGKNLDQFEQSFFNSSQKVDYKIKQVKKNTDGTFTLKLKNKTGLNTPFNIYAYKNHKPMGVVWFDGFYKSKMVTFPKVEADYFKLDGNDKLQDINRKNNIIKTSGIFKKVKPPIIRLANITENNFKTPINITPMFSANQYNGFIVGAAIHNYGLYKKKLEYALVPMFGFSSKTFVGLGEINYNFFPKKHFRQIVLGVKGRSFAYDYYTTSALNQKFNLTYPNSVLNFYKLSPYIEFEFKKHTANSPVQQIISYQSNHLFVDSLNNFSSVNVFPKALISNRYSFVNQFQYALQNKRIIDPFRLSFFIQHSASMIKTFVVYHQKITTGKNHFFDIRMFAGTFLAGNADERGYYAFRASGYNGSRDNLFEGMYFGRNNFGGFGFSQFLETDGALKIWTPLGQTPYWMTSINVKSPKFFRMPIKLFADAVVCDARSLNNDKVLWDAGINLTIANDMIEIYFPFFYNADIKKTLELNNIGFFNRIRFTFNIHKFDPKNFIVNNIL